MKKLFTISLLAVMTLFVFICGIAAQDLVETELEISDETTEENLIEFSYDELDVATINPLNGNFFNSIWNNATSDIDVRMMIHGYDLVKWDIENGVYLPDETVVSGIAITPNEYGDQTFTIVLYPDLYYSDGTPITAWDYAFSTLLTMSHEAEAIGAEVRRPEYIAGYEDYINGVVPYLSGFHVIDNDMFAVTIKQNYLPFFYELGLLSTIPYPISVIAPGVRVADDGNGIYLRNENNSGAPVFTPGLLRETILDPVSGYMSHPAVTSGPYKLVSYEDGKVVFEINPYYKGDAKGVLPQIQTVTFEALGSDEIIDALASGEKQLLNKMASSDIIMSGIAAVGENNAQLAFANYPRTGLGFINLHTERPVLNELAVRKALSHLMDKDEFLALTIGNFGLRVDGYYGMGQWMYQILSGTMAYPVEEPGPDNDMTNFEYDRQMREWEKLTLEDIPVYEFDPEAAAALLDRAGWNMNQNNAAYQRGVDSMRYKLINDRLVPLQLTMAYPAGTSVEAGLQLFADNAAEAGINIVMTAIPMEDILVEYYADEPDRKYDMLFIALNFDVMFDPSRDFEHEGLETPVWTKTGLADKELYEQTVNMRTTEPGDLLAYCQHWLAYQQRLAEVVPVIPLYSNVYFDFYARVLQDYYISSNVSWAEAVVPAFLGEIVEEEEILPDGEFEEFE